MCKKTVSRECWLSMTFNGQKELPFMLCQKRLYLYVVHYKILILFNQYLREENKCKKLTHSQFVSIQYVCLSVCLSICLSVCLSVYVPLESPQRVGSRQRCPAVRSPPGFESPPQMWPTGRENISATTTAILPCRSSRVQISARGLFLGRSKGRRIALWYTVRIKLIIQVWL